MNTLGRLFGSAQRTVTGRGTDADIIPGTGEPLTPTATVTANISLDQERDLVARTVDNSSTSPLMADDATRNPSTSASPGKRRLPIQTARKSTGSRPPPSYRAAKQPSPADDFALVGDQVGVLGAGEGQDPKPVPAPVTFDVDADFSFGDGLEVPPPLSPPPPPANHDRIASASKKRERSDLQGPSDEVVDELRGSKRQKESGSGTRGEEEVGEEDGDLHEEEIEDEPEAEEMDEPEEDNSKHRQPKTTSKLKTTGQARKAVDAQTTGRDEGQDERESPAKSTSKKRASRTYATPKKAIKRKQAETIDEAGDPDGSEGSAGRRKRTKRATVGSAKACSKKPKKTQSTAKYQDFEYAEDIPDKDAFKDEKMMKCWTSCLLRVTDPEDDSTPPPTPSDDASDAPDAGPQLKVSVGDVLYVCPDPEFLDSGEPDRTVADLEEQEKWLALVKKIGIRLSDLEPEEGSAKGNQVSNTVYLLVEWLYRAKDLSEKAKIAMTKRGDMACIGENELFHSDHEGVISNESVLWPGFANVVQYNDRFPGNPLKDHKGDIEPFRVQRARFRLKPLDPNKNNGDKHPEPINPHLIGFENLYYWRVNFKTDPKEAKKADGGLGHLTKFCTSHRPYAPWKVMHYCPGCREWYYRAHLLKMGNVEDQSHDLRHWSELKDDMDSKERAKDEGEIRQRGRSWDLLTIASELSGLDLTVDIDELVKIARSPIVRGGPYGLVGNVKVVQAAQEYLDRLAKGKEDAIDQLGDWRDKIGYREWQASEKERMQAFEKMMEVRYDRLTGRAKPKDKRAAKGRGHGKRKGRGQEDDDEDDHELNEGWALICPQCDMVI